MKFLTDDLLLGIFCLHNYIILAIQTDSFLLPLIQMSAIPVTIIGIMPGFYLLNLIASHKVGGYENPVYFTATAMIGMIALGGIVIRNSSVLINFIQVRVAEGASMKEAILESGVVRMRPIFLTAVTAAIGVWPITLDPIFSGLAWSLIFGLVVSTAFSLIIVPAFFRIKFLFSSFSEGVHQNPSPFTELGLRSLQEFKVGK